MAHHCCIAGATSAHTAVFVTTPSHEMICGLLKSLSGSTRCFGPPSRKKQGSLAAFRFRPSARGDLAVLRDFKRCWTPGLHFAGARLRAMAGFFFLSSRRAGHGSRPNNAAFGARFDGVLFVTHPGGGGRLKTYRRPHAIRMRCPEARGAVGASNPQHGGWCQRGVRRLHRYVARTMTRLPRRSNVARVPRDAARWKNSRTAWCAAVKSPHKEPDRRPTESLTNPAVDSSGRDARTVDRCQG